MRHDVICCFKLARMISARIVDIKKVYLEQHFSIHKNPEVAVCLGRNERVVFGQLGDLARHGVRNADDAQTVDFVGMKGVGNWNIEDVVATVLVPMDDARVTARVNAESPIRLE